MKGFTRGITMAAVALAAMLPASRSHADTVEQQLEELKQMVIQLQEVVQQQGQTIMHQEQLIRELQTQVPPPEEMARRFEPHLDKHILHERSGVGEQLGNLRIAVGLTGVVQGSIDGEDISGQNRDQTDGSWSMDLELESPVGERGLVFMLIEAGQGDGLTDELEGLFHNVNDDAGDSESGLEVTEAWYQHSFLDDRVALAVGKLDMTNYFDTNTVANDERFQFLNSGLVNSIAVEFPEDNGAGALLAVYPAEWVEFGLGWAESDADWEDIANDGFGIAEVNLKPNFHEREGNYRFYAWANGSDKEELGDGDSHKNGWGVGLSFDQQLTDCLTAFLRAGYRDRDVYEVEGTWSAGAEVRGSKWNRENDMLGFAVSQALISDKVEPDDTETLFEAYYSIMFSDQFRLSPDIQIIDNPGGDADNDTVIVLGTRAQVDF
jgi:hypothetical protein